MCCAVLGRVRGAADAQKQVFSGAAEWQVVVDRDELARYGLNISNLRDVVQAAVGGKPVTEFIDGRRRFQVAVRLPESYRRDRDALGSILLAAPAGEQVPLDRVAEIRRASGPEVVHREDSQRRIVVQCNVRGRDMGSFVAEAQRRIPAIVDLPTGYYIVWSGQFENQQRAMQRLMLVLPGSPAGDLHACCTSRSDPLNSRCWCCSSYCSPRFGGDRDCCGCAE